MPITYEKASEVKSIAEELIKKHHPHLVNVKIEYVYRSEHAKSGGKEVWGKARKIGGLNAWLATPAEDRWTHPEPFFVMEIAKDIWKKLTETAQTALVDHELNHMGRDVETGDLQIEAHDVEDFAIILQRYGLYRAEAEMFVRVGAQQLSLLAIAEDRAESGELNERVTFERLNGDSLTLTKEELLAALYKLELESKTGLILDRVAEQINDGAMNGDGVTVTAEVGRPMKKLGTLHTPNNSSFDRIEFYGQKTKAEIEQEKQ